MNNKELYHYGVLGMKWGKRKASSGLSRRSQKKQSAASLDKQTVKNIKSSKSPAKGKTAAKVALGALAGVGIAAGAGIAALRFSSRARLLYGLGAECVRYYLKR